MEVNRRELLAGMLLGAVTDRPAAAETLIDRPAAAESAPRPERIAPMAHAGYETQQLAQADAASWVQVDLGADCAIDAVRLYPVNDFTTPDAFPARFRLDASSDPSFAQPAPIADHTGADYASPGDQIRSFAAGGIKARYVRLTVTRLRPRGEKAFWFALAKLDVVSGGRDVAEGRPITDSAKGLLGVTALTRPPRPVGEGVHTDNPANVIPDGRWKPVSYRAQVPRGGVRLDPGPLKTAFDNNITYLLNSWTADELVREFRDRAGKPNPTGLRKQAPFWERDLAGSNAGRFLMGAGNALRWTDHPELRRRLDYIVDVIEECRQPNGYIMAYPEDSIFYSERAGYTRAWVTHGLIEAGYSGNPKAFGLLRGYYDWFDECRYLPELLRGTAQGVQGMIANTRMFFTPVGRPKDVQVVQRYFQENYWLDQLGRREEKAIWQYPYDRPHCYLITDLEAYLDLYRATGARRYLDASLGGWELYQSDWEHTGGTIAIVEFGVYPPKSYLLHAETGELCGNVFWAFFNQRLHMLDPERETYVNEIEKSIYNVALANQAGDRGIRYHARLAGRTGDPEEASWDVVVNTCCAGQGTRIYGALPEFIYSLADDGVYVNLFAASTIEWKQAGQPVELHMTTDFPFRRHVELRLSTRQAVRARIRLRVPAWAARDMPVQVNGAGVAVGKAGSYVVLDRTWKNDDVISFVLPAEFRLTHYTGQERVPGHELYALEYGPILMALVGDVDEKGGARLPHGPGELIRSLAPKAGHPLTFRIDGDPAYEYIPYWQVGERVFTCYPELAGA